VNATTITPAAQTAAALHPAVVLAALRQQHQDALLTYLTERVPPADWCRVETLADQAWAYALEHADLATPGSEPGTDLPVWLAATARIAIRRHLTPASAFDPHWAALAQMLGHLASWPEHWHQVLAAHGQAALLRQMADELEEEEDSKSASPVAALAA
jgi:hypothetical protein